MSAKRISSAFMTLMILHLVIAFVAGLYLVSQTQRFQELLAEESLKPVAPPTPQVRKRPPKPTVKPRGSTQNPVVVERVKMQTRRATSLSPRLTFQLHTVVEFTHKVFICKPPIHPHVPKVTTPNTPVPDAVTHVDFVFSDAPGALPFSAPVRRAPRMAPANGGRSIVSSTVQPLVAFKRVPGLAMVESVGAAHEAEALADVVESIMLGHDDVPRLPRGEPGGRIIGKGRDFRGVLRFARIRHNLSDWWANPSSLNALTQWINERTKIKADMNVEGGAIRLTDANLHKSPLVFMTGHDPSLTRSHNLLGRQYGGGRLDGRLSEAEAAGLRRYLIRKGGFLLFDDCGVNAPAQAMVRLFMAQMRYVIPEYQIERIPNAHEVYNNFYKMGGPPVGFDIFWWGTKPQRRNFLEGISVGDKLSVIVVRRDYLCAMRSVSLPSYPVHYSPAVYRFMTNVAIYALTHGNIADYSDYIPEDKLAKQALPTSAPQAVGIGALE